MRTTLGTLGPLLLAAGSAIAQSEDSTIWSTTAKGGMDSGWVVVSPNLSSDYFSVGYKASPTLNVENGNVSKAMPIKGVAVSVADFGTSQTYPTVGVFRPNPTLDPSGNTPDLSLPIATSNETYAGGLTLFAFQDFDTIAEGTIPVADATTCSVVQLPPGDSGLLAVGADSSAAAGLTSGFTQDGFTTPTVTLTFLDLGINIGQDNSTTTSCKASDRAKHGRLRCQQLSPGGIMAGDHLTTTIAGGDTLNLAFFGSNAGDQWRMYFTIAPCSPTWIPLGPVWNTIADGDGDGSFLRINATFPSGFGGQTYRFSAVWGNSSCLRPSAGFTNCVTVITAPVLEFGIIDDCTMESGWVVNVPALSSDYFNDSFGAAPPSVNGVTGLTISVFDFVTATPEYPAAGVSLANVTLDPTANSPHVQGTGLLATVSPFTFPPGTFATTCAQFISHQVSVDGSALTGPSIHGWVQFPPGDPGLLGVGADTSSGSAGRSFFSLDAYTTPAVAFFPNWGIRLETN